MSHVSAMKVEIKDVECLARACDRMGWEFKMNSRQFKSYAGFTNCDHEIVVPGASYTVGVKAAASLRHSESHGRRCLQGHAMRRGRVA